MSESDQNKETCRTCRWWAKQDVEGHCLRINTRQSAIDVYNGSVAPNTARILLDSFGFDQPMLVTHPSFGCSLWQSKDGGQDGATSST
jgi:hypothetical protein